MTFTRLVSDELESPSLVETTVHSSNGSHDQLSIVSIFYAHLSTLIAFVSPLPAENQFFPMQYATALSAAGYVEEAHEVFAHVIRRLNYVWFNMEGGSEVVRWLRPGGLDGELYLQATTYMGLEKLRFLNSEYVFFLTISLFVGSLRR